MNLRWRSLRVQVLLWTVLPLTILLIAFSLTGIGTHQASMRIMAEVDNAQLAVAIAAALAQRVDGYVTGLQAAAEMLAHHAGDSPIRQSLMEETSLVLGAAELAVTNSDGTPISSLRPVPPAWSALKTADLSFTAPSLAVEGETLLVSVPLTTTGAEQAALIAGVPLFRLVDPLQDVAAAGEGTTILLRDGESILFQTPAGADAAEMAEHGSDDWVATALPVDGTPWTLHVGTPWHTRALPMIRFPEAMPFILLVAAAVSFLSLYSGLRLVARPLQQLEARTRRIGEGDFSAAAKPVGGVNEIESVRLAMDQMAERLRSSQRALERYLYATTAAQEEERARLARELHDETVQGLIALDHRLQKAQRTIQREPETLKEEITTIRQLVRTEMEEVRRFSRALRPLYLEDLGLSPALELLCKEVGASFAASGEPRRLDPAIELSLYRIAQESLSNARRHAQAQQIDVLLTFAPTAVTVRVQDDGIGFSPPEQIRSLTREGHFGLMGIQERADLIGAQVRIDSSPGHGTAVTVTVAV